MSTLILAMPGNETMGANLAARLRADVGSVALHTFPDGETHVRLGADTRGRSVVLVSTLDRPDTKFLPLAFCAATARDLGASKVGLIAPYLSYMRQDHRFTAGEAITSRVFAHQLSGIVDWLVTVDPHLHRLLSLAEVYTVPTRTVHSSPLIARWIKDNVSSPILIGPDAESAQWVSAVAEMAGAPFVVSEKTRHGDADVAISLPDMTKWRRHTPVLVDDIISTGHTMIGSLMHLRDARMRPAVCVGVHAVFAPGAFEGLEQAGVARVVTTNTIQHHTNAIDVTRSLAEAAALLAR